MKNNLKNTLNNILSFTFVIIALIALIIGLTQIRKKNTRSITSPVETIQLDSLNKVNTKLIIEVEHLDSIKDAKVIEVKSLDNDSTLKLFYKLISEE